MKFRNLEQGPIEGRTEDFDRGGGRVDKIRVLALLAGRDREIEAGAALYVTSENKRFPDAPPALIKPGDPTYERGIYAWTVFLAVRDPDDGQPYFASVAEMLDPDRGLDRDRLAWLFEVQQQAQSDFAPQRGALSNEQFFDWMAKTAEAPAGTDLPFERSPRATQRLYHRGIARSYKDLLTAHWTLMQEVALLRSQTSSPQDKSRHGQSAPAGEASSAPSAEPSMASPPTTPPMGAGEP